MRLSRVFRVILFLLLGCSTLLNFGQNKTLQINGIEGLKLNYKKIVSDSLASNVVIQSVQQELYNLGYLTAKVDSVHYRSDIHSAYFTKGQIIKWVSLEHGNLTEDEISEFGFAPANFNGKPLNIKKINTIFKRVITHFENNGYPFISVKLDDVQFNDNNNVSAKLRIEKNTFYKVDSIKIIGNSGVTPTYLSNYIGIEQGDIYNEAKIIGIENRIREIPFVISTQKPQIQFFEEGVKIIIDLKRKKASRFDGVVGLLTNENTGKIELTGDVDLRLTNAIKKGETFGLNWRKLKGNSQDLNVDAIYPYLFKTPFGIDFNFKLFKRDTTFLDLETKLGVNYLLERGDFISIFVENKSSTLLSREVFADAIQLPELGDVTINSFGVAYSGNKTNYKYNPTKGLNLRVDFAAGRKRLKKISVIEQKSPELYDSVKLTTNQLRGGLFIEYFIPLAQRSTIRVANRSASLYSERIYSNELMRIGGLRTLRGFDEESINASSYSIFSLEYRFLLDRNSFFSLFSDYGIYESNTIRDGRKNYTQDTPLGIGAGVSFETKAGIFTFNYAVGSQMGNPIEIRAAKIHFGFINFF